MTEPRLESWWVGPYRDVEQVVTKAIHPVQPNRLNRVMAHVDQRKRFTMSETLEVEEAFLTPQGMLRNNSRYLVEKNLERREGLRKDWKL